MVDRKEQAKASMWCVLAFIMGCVVCMFMGCNEAHGKIDHSRQYQIEYGNMKTKSVRQIIKDILDRKKPVGVPPKWFEFLPAPTYPIPLYDGVDWDRLKGVA